MSSYYYVQKARLAVTKDEYQNLFSVEHDYVIIHCVAKDLKMCAGIATVFNTNFEGVEALRRQQRKAVLHVDHIRETCDHV